MTGTTWQIDSAHTDVGFAVKHMMISTVKGRFADVSGTIAIDEADLAGSSIDVTISTASVDTRQEQRDAHLRSADFFDVENYPTLTFRSRRVESTGNGEFRVVGDLTIRGVTREVVLEATDEGRGKDPWGNERAGFSAKTVIDRRDFGLTWNAALETGGILVGTDIRISLEVEAVKAEAAAVTAA
ncbi:MAG TPA: YceI family protein [Longimicrobiales bacterium]